MGMRGEIFTSQVVCEGRTYFFNVKENRMGDLFLAIVESKPTEAESFDRRSIVIFKENLREFLQSFEKALSAMEKAPSKRHTGRRSSEGDRPSRPMPGEETLGRPSGGAPRGGAPRGDRQKTRIVRPKREGSSAGAHEGEGSREHAPAPRPAKLTDPRGPGAKLPTIKKRMTVKRAEPKTED